MFQGVYLDIVAYEHIVDSVKVKADQLLVQSAASRASADLHQLVKRYTVVRSLTKVRGHCRRGGGGGGGGG